MKRTGLILIISCVFISQNPASAQEELGLRLGNYSGVNGLMWNPASTVSSPLNWDINIIAAGAFAENNYIFIQDANLFKVIKNREGYYFAGDLNNGEIQEAPTGLAYDYTTGTQDKAGYSDVFITGPSAMFRIKDHTLGIFMNGRSVTSTNRVSSILGYYDIDALQTGDVIEVDPFKAATLMWSEIGLNYGQNLIHDGRFVLDVGASVKFIQGYESAYFINQQNTSITLQDDFMTYNNGAEVQYGVASGMQSTNGDYQFRSRGIGGSIDFGAVMYIKSNKQGKAYDWKISAALLDFGRIRFGKDAQMHVITTESVFDFVQSEYEGNEDFDDYYQTLSLQSLSDDLASYSQDHFGIWTPAGISVSAEYAFTQSLILNASVIRRLRFFGAVPERENLFAITPRFEKRWFDISVPLVLYNDRDFRLGTAVRLGPLVVGSDNLTSWFGSSNFSGSDIYFALKINPMDLGGGLGGSGRSAKNGGQKCYDF